MSKVDVYIGGYLLIDEVTKEQSDRLASGASSIGMPLTIEYRPESEDFILLTTNGDSIGSIRPKNKLSFREALEGGWACRCWLSLVFYDNAEKLFKGEIVYQLYNVKPSQTAEKASLDAYAQKTSERLAAGERPNVTLTGTGYDAVIATGDYDDGSKVALPIDTTRSSGTVIFKRKRGISDKLITAALERKPGCLIAAAVAVVAVIGLIVFLIFRAVSGS